MFGLAFRFPAGRYHATPWGRAVNEADVAWPPEPWRILRALVACYWRKSDRERWGEDDLARLIDTLAQDLPVFHLPTGAIHAHTRHYMPGGRLTKGQPKRTLVFDAFLHLPREAEVIAIWKQVTLDGDLLALATDLASGMGYLGRAESWTECRVVAEVQKEPNCGPAELGFDGEWLRVLVPRSPAAYSAARTRLRAQEEERVRGSTKGRVTESALRGKVDKAFRGKRGTDTLPPRLVDAIAVDTADIQHCKWDQPPAAYQAIYARQREATAGVVPRSPTRVGSNREVSSMPTVARYLLAGRPLPRIEDAVKIGEVMRTAAMSKFGWDADAEGRKRIPLAPWQISGRDADNHPVSDPTHPHAFWLPEDADGDGWIDHVTVFIASGMGEDIQAKLDMITRIWLSPKGARGGSSKDSRVDEWRLALEGFGNREDFAGSSRVLAASRRWRSVTPFLASGHLKKAGHSGELLRLLKRRGIDTEGVVVEEKREIKVGGNPRHVLNFRRFRANRREKQRDASGAFLDVEFPRKFQGPLALGYGSHFGLGMFGAR